jgi:hypothetical protein
MWTVLQYAPGRDVAYNYMASYIMSFQRLSCCLHLFKAVCIFELGLGGIKTFYFEKIDDFVEVNKFVKDMDAR